MLNQAHNGSFEKKNGIEHLRSSWYGCLRSLSLDEMTAAVVVMGGGLARLNWANARKGSFNQEPTISPVPRSA